MLLIAMDLDGTLLPQPEKGILGRFPKRDIDKQLPDSIIERKEFAKLIEITKEKVAYGIVTNGVNKARAVVVMEGLGLHENQLIQAFLPKEAMHINAEPGGHMLIEDYKQYHDDWGNRSKLTVFVEDLPTDYYAKLCKIWPNINFEREGAGKNLHIANMIKIHNKTHPDSPITHVCLVEDSEWNVNALAYFRELAEKLDDDELRKVKIEAVKIEKNKGYMAQVTQKVNIYRQQFVQSSAVNTPTSETTSAKSLFFLPDLISLYQQTPSPNNLQTLFEALCKVGKGKAMGVLGNACLVRNAFREAYYFYVLAYAVEDAAENKEYFWDKIQKAQNCCKLLVKFDNFSAKHFDLVQKNQLLRLMQNYIGEDDRIKCLDCWQEILVLRDKLLVKLPTKTDGHGNVFEENDLTSSKNVFYATAAQINTDECPAYLAKCRLSFAEALISWVQPLDKSEITLASQLDRADYYADKLIIGLQLIQKLPSDKLTNRLREMFLGKYDSEKAYIVQFIKARYTDSALKEVIEAGPDWLKAYLGFVNSTVADLPKQCK